MKPIWFFVVYQRKNDEVKVQVQDESEPRLLQIHRALRPQGGSPAIDHERQEILRRLSQRLMYRKYTPPLS